MDLWAEPATLGRTPVAVASFLIGLLVGHSGTASGTVPWTARGPAGGELLCSLECIPEQQVAKLLAVFAFRACCIVALLLTVLAWMLRTFRAWPGGSMPEVVPPVSWDPLDIVAEEKAAFERHRRAAVRHGHHISALTVGLIRMPDLSVNPAVDSRSSCSTASGEGPASDSTEAADSAEVDTASRPGLGSASASQLHELQNDAEAKEDEAPKEDEAKKEGCREEDEADEAQKSSDAKEEEAPKGRTAGRSSEELDVDSEANARLDLGRQVASEVEPVEADSEPTATQSPDSEGALEEQQDVEPFVGAHAEDEVGADFEIEMANADHQVQQDEVQAESEISGADEAQEWADAWAAAEAEVEPKAGAAVSLPEDDWSTCSFPCGGLWSDWSDDAYVQTAPGMWPSVHGTIMQTYPMAGMMPLYGQMPGYCAPYCGSISGQLTAPKTRSRGASGQDTAGSSRAAKFCIGDNDRPPRGDSERDQTLRSIMKALEAVEPERILQVRRIKHLGFGSARTIRTHCTQYGQVEKVFVSHSRAQTRVRPASLGFVVMADVASTQAVLAAGLEQQVGGAPIRLGPFERHAVAEASEARDDKA